MRAIIPLIAGVGLLTSTVCAQPVVEASKAIADGDAAIALLWTSIALQKSPADQVLRRILPAGAEPDFRDPSGTIRIDHIPVPEVWIGNRTVEFQMQSRSRIAWIDRLGEGMLPTRETVLQEGDMLHIVIREENAAHAYAVLEAGPEDD